MIGCGNDADDDFSGISEWDAAANGRKREVRASSDIDTDDRVKLCRSPKKKRPRSRLNVSRLVGKAGLMQFVPLELYGRVC